MFFPVAQTVKNQPAMQETGVWSLGREDPLEREWQSTPVFLPGESHGQRSLVGHSLWDHKESDMTGQLTLLLFGVTNFGYKNTNVHNCPCVCLFQDLYFFMQLLVTVQCSFNVLCRTPLGIFADRSNGHQLTQFLSDNVLTSYSLLKDSFARYRIVGRLAFSLNTSHILADCLLTSNVFDEKYVYNLMRSPQMW